MADRDRHGAVRFIHAVAALLVAQALGPPSAGATAFPPPPLRLPPDAFYDRTVGADSAVVFRHSSHVSLTGYRCTPCHPKPFRILAPTRGISHHAMNAGASCGSCHDGVRAFGVRDRESCATCHVGRPTLTSAAKDRVPGAARSSPGPRGPRPITYARGEGSPGQVTFRHATHAGSASGCAACHPRPFAMRSAGPRPAGGMHDDTACGRCHDGGRAFVVTDADGCARCHVEPGGAP